MDHMNKIFLESVGTFFDFIGTEWGAVYLIASIVTVSAIIAAIWAINRGLTRSKFGYFALSALYMIIAWGLILYCKDLYSYYQLHLLDEYMTAYYNSIQNLFKGIFGGILG